VEADLSVDALDVVLAAAGFVAGEPAMFTAEGLTMYLAERDVIELLTTLADLGGAGSRLAVNFGVGFQGGDSLRARVRALVGRFLIALGREPFKFEIAPSQVSAFLARLGWIVEEVLAGPQLAERYLRASRLPITRLNPHACVVTAMH
jgi:O-methyltransferase involved in polyketide biosynthesis